MKMTFDQKAVWVTTEEMKIMIENGIFFAHVGCIQDGRHIVIPWHFERLDEEHIHYEVP